MLIKFPNHLYRVYFPLKDDKMVIKLSKLLKVPNLTKFLKKNASGLKWKLLEAELKRKRSEHGSMIEKDKLIALGIFGLVLFPSLTSVISLEVVVVFVEYTNPELLLVIEGHKVQSHINSTPNVIYMLHTNSYFL